MVNQTRRATNQLALASQPQENQPEQTAPVVVAQARYSAADAPMVLAPHSELT